MSNARRQPIVAGIHALTDDELVSAIRVGNLTGLGTLFDRHGTSVRRLLLRLGVAPRDVDDLVQDTFLDCIVAAPTYQSGLSVRSWLFGIAVRTVAIRFQKRTRQRWLRFMAPEEVPEIATELPEAGLGEALRDVYAILRGMDADERIALVLHRVDGLSLEAAASAASTSLATYRRRLARAETKFFARAASRPALQSWIAEGSES